MMQTLAMSYPKLTPSRSNVTIDGMDYISVDEAADITEYAKDHIRRLVRQKKIKATKKGLMWWIELESLKEYKQKMDELGNDKFFEWREKQD